MIECGGVCVWVSGWVGRCVGDCVGVSVGVWVCGCGFDNIFSINACVCLCVQIHLQNAGDSQNSNEKLKKYT